jgi:hypothetical protein
MNCWSRTAGPSISPRCPDRLRMWMDLMLNVISCLVDVGRGKVKISRSSPASTLSGVASPAGVRICRYSGDRSTRGRFPPALSRLQMHPQGHRRKQSGEAPVLEPHWSSLVTGLCSTERASPENAEECCSDQQRRGARSSVRSVRLRWQRKPRVVNGSIWQFSTTT